MCLVHEVVCVYKYIHVFFRDSMATMTKGFGAYFGICTQAFVSLQENDRYAIQVGA